MCAMLLIKIYRFFFGKLKLRVKGEFVERILNLCTYNGLTIWGIRKREDAIFLYMSVRDFRLLRKIVRGTHLRVHICKKIGFPFLFNRYKRRYGLFAGAAMFFLLLNLMSGFVWNIKVEGNSLIAGDVIIAACNDVGIREGIPVSAISPSEDKIDLQLAVDGISWAAINIEGCILTVNVSEIHRTEPEEKEPCNLVAQFDGVIKKIEANEGNAEVTVGQAVTKGDLLVSGVVELKNGSVHFVRADGMVMAEVYENHKVSVPLKQTVKQLATKSSNRYALSLFGIKIPLYLGGGSGEYFKCCERMTISNGRAYLPFYLYKTNFREIEKHNISLSEEQALGIARESINKRLGDAEIIDKKEKIVCDDETLILESEITVIKNIAIKENLLINATN